MLERIEGLVRAAVPGLAIYCGQIPAGAGIENARNCIILSRTDIDEATIEVRLSSTCQHASSAVDDVLGALESAGAVRDVLGRYDSPGPALDRAGHTVVVAV